MTLTDEVVGRTLATATAYDVTGEVVAAFRDATSGPGVGPADAGGAAAPPTFPIVVVFPLLQRLLDELEIPLSRVVHAEQRFTHERAVRAGDRLGAVLTVRSVRRMGDDALLSLRTEVRDDADLLVCTATTTLLSRGAAA